MNPDELYLAHHIDRITARRLADWDARIARARGLPSTRWQRRAGMFLRAASSSASTRIEGNQLSLWSADHLLTGGRIDRSAGRERDVREVERYAEALDLVEDLAAREPFAWQELVVQQLNATVLRGLEHDTRGAWRTRPVSVGGYYAAPHASAVPHLMRALVEWLRRTNTHPLIRAAVLHINLVAIHPWFDGNGRTTRLACLLDVDREVRASQLVSIDPFLAVHQAEYVRRIRVAVGPSWDPGNHVITAWVAWYVRAHLAALASGEAVVEATHRDVQVIIAALEHRDEPTDWGPLILASTFGPFTIGLVQRTYGSSPPAARAMVARLVSAGWLVAEGETRARRYRPSARVDALGLASFAAASRWALGSSEPT